MTTLQRPPVEARCPASSRALAVVARRRICGSPAARLTERQREIAALVTTGASNAEIARRLWLTRRTVEFHLTNVYRALEVRSRSELVRVLLAGGGRSP